MSASNSRTLDYNSPAVPKISWDRLRAMFLIAAWIAAIGASACAALMLWAGRLPPPGGVLWIFGLLIGLTSTGPWMASAAVELVLVKWVGRAARRQTTLLLLLTPAILATTYVLLATGLPCRLMFRANRPAMDRWVQTYLATRGTPPSQARIGSYEACNIAAIPGGVEFDVLGSGFFRSAGGFAYCPSGPPVPSAYVDETFTAIGGAWYVRTYWEP